MTEWRFRSHGRTLHATGPVWETDEDYLALISEGLPEIRRTTAPGGIFMLRPFKSARPAVRSLLAEYGFRYVGMAKSTDDVKRDWLLFRKS